MWTLYFADPYPKVPMLSLNPDHFCLDPDPYLWLGIRNLKKKIIQDTDPSKMTRGWIDNSLQVVVRFLPGRLGQRPAEPSQPSHSHLGNKN